MAPFATGPLACTGLEAFAPGGGGAGGHAHAGAVLALGALAGGDGSAARGGSGVCVGGWGMNWKGLSGANEKACVAPVVASFAGCSL